jgi:diadenosine tetraphosphate (Ap4A) HIT family hydrolase
MQERRYPWIVLVPTLPNLTEITDLSEKDQIRLILESSSIANQMKRHLVADKINVAAIGNLVPQLHWHVISRYRDDAAWPAPVWGRFAPEAYAPGEVITLVERLRLSQIQGFQPEEIV